MNYKLKHLAKFCCRPQNETEFEAVKMAAELGGFKAYGNGTFKKFTIGEDYFTLMGGRIYLSFEEGDKELIPVIDFIKKLRMTEEEAMELEDDRVEIIGFDTYRWGYKDKFTLIPKNGHYFRVSEDGKTVTLHKEKQ